MQPSIRRPLGWLLAAIAAIPLASMAFQAAKPVSNGQPPPVKLTNQEDHQRLMALLHMTEIRRGKNGSGDKNDPNFANYDEAKANPYPDLPDPLKLKNGKKVTKASDWWSKRRPEIVERFRSRGLWPRPQSYAKGEVGSRQHHRRQERRNRHRHKEAHRHGGQFFGPGYRG